MARSSEVSKWSSLRCRMSRSTFRREAILVILKPNLTYCGNACVRGEALRRMCFSKRVEKVGYPKSFQQHWEVTGLPSRNTISAQMPEDWGVETLFPKAPWTEKTSSPQCGDMSEAGSLHYLHLKGLWSVNWFNLLVSVEFFPLETTKLALNYNAWPSIRYIGKQSSQRWGEPLWKQYVAAKILEETWVKQRTMFPSSP